MTEHPGAAMYDDLEKDPCRSEIVLRRMARFVGAGGICEAYERRGDKLVQFHDIANLIADTVPAVGREAVVRLFLFSVKTDWFGRHGPRQTIEQLIDLDNFHFTPRGRYSLRPSFLRVEASPEYMRAPRSVWAQWIKARGWPIPPELEHQLPSGTVTGGCSHNRGSVMAGEFDTADPATWTPSQRELMDAWRRRRDRDRHENRIAAWVARQQVSHDWVNFAEIADWCAREPGGVRRDEDRRAQAFYDLGRSVTAGEFSRAGRSCVVRPPDGPTLLSEPLRLRVTLAWLRKWPAFHDGMTIPDRELARWWVPQDLCAAWFERRQIAPPPWLSEGNEQRTPHAQPPPPVMPMDYRATYRAGLPGRPTSWHLIEGECRRRYQTGERHPNNAGREITTEWARVLGAWLSQNHPDAAHVSQKTLTNKLAGLLRELQAVTPTKS